ncbi:DUF2793 domain-containing protein [Sphingomonas jatrophae]|uniref:DUF2793 domain-containing protein n=1 Tax=Sphingomonas jatrophae TaxID=1166337 RepID=A0A1I6L3U9_9SPHN|nr:DUF2793 domain-containing protein [Sphingomonas jatrophae]SFR97958.1 Protein of unknown function [Sphingomonas jatrophae]
MMQDTARLALPLIAAGQAQKDVFHNEALVRLDALVQGAVETMGAEIPPANPAEGKAWILGGTPGGAWADRAHDIAWWSTGGWRFAEPRDGMVLWVRDAECWALHTAAGWQLGAIPAKSLTVGGQAVVGARRGAVADPSGGESIDVQARSAIAEILDALRGHGLISR